MGFCFFNNAAIAARAAQVWRYPLLHLCLLIQVVHAIRFQSEQDAVAYPDAHNMPVIAQTWMLRPAEFELYGTIWVHVHLLVCMNALLVQ